MLFRISPFLLAVAIFTGLGCGDDGGPTDSGTPDGAADADTDTGITIAEPDIPWLEDGVPPIQMTPCPEGWREVTERDVTVCAPYPEGGRETCGAGDAHFPGETGCRPVGDPCPAGNYATTLPSEGPVLYVEAGAAPGGDGSLSLPYAALSDVNWTGLAANTTVALGKGTFSGTLILKAGVRLVGACAEETILLGAAGRLTAVISAQNAGAAAVLRNVTLSNTPQRGAEATRGANLEIRGAVFDRIFETAVAALDLGTTVTLVDTVVRETRRGSRSTGNGLLVDRGGRLDATRTLLIRNPQAGAVLLGAGSELALRDSVIESVSLLSADTGVGVYSRAGERIHLERVLMTGGLVHLLVLESDTEVTITDSVLAGTVYDPDAGRGGQGIYADGATLNLTRLRFTGHPRHAIAAFRSPTTVTLTDSVIHCGEETTETDAAGLFARLGGRIDATRVVVEEASNAGAVAADEGSVVTLTDVALRASNPPLTETTSGFGVIVQDGAHGEATRLLVSRAYTAGIFVAGRASTMQLADAVVHDTLASPLSGAGGRGINVQNGADFDGLRLFVEESHQVGIFGGNPDTQLVLTDTVIRDTMPNPNDESRGDGIMTISGTLVEGVRVKVDGAFETGISAYTGSTIGLEDAVIANVRGAACDPDACPFGAAGFGVTAIGGTIRLTSFSVRDAETCGVFIAPPESGSLQSAVDFQSGSVSGALIGACVQVAGYALERLTSDVMYYDNGTSLDPATLAVPRPPDALPAARP